MARAFHNWERLVRATLQGERLRIGGRAHGRTLSGLVGAVPPSLGKTTNIEAILQAADEIQNEDPNVARILCEQAYSMAQNLDPNSGGRGVLQFKTGLMSVIKQKLAKKDGSKIDRQHDIERLWEFYQAYKQRHRVEDIKKEEGKWMESGAFNTNLGESGLRSQEMKKVYATLRALIEVMDVLTRDAAIDDRVGRLIMEELRRVKKSEATLTGELTPYNIVPLDAPSITNLIGRFPEVRAAISAIHYTVNFPRLPADFEVPSLRNLDMFDLLQYVLGFQNDNIRNQRENVVLSIANAQSHLGIPDGVEPKIDEEAKARALTAATTELERFFRKEDFGRMKVIGQFNLGFIIEKVDKDLFIVDQHAVDEKYNFEKLSQSTILNQQPLLQPMRLELSPEEEVVASVHMDIIRKNGFTLAEDASAPSGHRFLLKAVPFSKNITFGAEDVKELISTLTDSQGECSIMRSYKMDDPNSLCPSRVWGMLASRACRSSVMIGDPLGQNEMKKILKHLVGLKSPWNCPHGRPTMPHLLDLTTLRNK